ncbi:hypothetical protein H4R18_000329 [Coemansia javaensis]|uniref:Peptidase S1 domain-containing protein n=1 Tax=Coemansia javaensis TaxID=2761396 RepID=A0A9W8HN11_9FUNG|nr:hypothetical protein H4R18_000329 [Coemansia javaensis]
MGIASWLAGGLAAASVVMALPSALEGAGGLVRRIMGGSDANYNDYTFIVYMYNEKEKTFCGGSIISDDWILTAAHCIKTATKDQMLVYVGMAEYKLDIAKGTKVAEVRTHPRYNDQTMANDIALIRLQQPVSGKGVSSIQIDSSSVGDGVTVTALGWGYTSPTSKKASPQLKKGDFKTLSQQQCGSIDSGFTGNNGPRICVAADRGPDTCPGDSGGPLIRQVGGKNVLVGITSFGTAGNKAVPNQCGGAGMVSLFTHASYFKSFIDSTAGALREVEGKGKPGSNSTSDNDSGATSPSGSAADGKSSAGPASVLSIAAIAGLAALTTLANI